jgi:hypothetical protein
MGCPIDKTTLAGVRKAIATLQELERQINLATEAGIDVAEDAARCVHLQQLAQQIVRVYEPEIRALGQIKE